MLGGEEELESEVWVDGIPLENVSEFKYLGCVLDIKAVLRPILNQLI